MTPYIGAQNNNPQYKKLISTTFSLFVVPNIISFYFVTQGTYTLT